MYFRGQLFYALNTLIMKDEKFLELLPSYGKRGQINLFLDKIRTIKAAINGDKTAKNKALDFIEGLEYFIHDTNNYSDLLDFEDFDLEDEPDSSFRKPTLEREKVEEYHIHIDLNQAPFMIYREVSIPSNATIDFAAHVLLSVMGWSGNYPYQVIHDDVQYTDPEVAKDSNSENIKSLTDYTLSDVFRRKFDFMTLLYDFDDKWKHTVYLKSIRKYRPDQKVHINYLSGSGGCPPENCGGIHAYVDLLNTLQKKRLSKDERENLEWLGIDRNFDPHEFDPYECKGVTYEWDKIMNMR